MSYQVLARKWRPKRFSEVKGQDHITSSIKNAIKRGPIGHAYLLTGTRGVGKTTIARIFAKALRCSSLNNDGDPCCQCSSCLEIDKNNAMDVIEIDGASNNGVDHIRELVSNVQFLPTYGKYKIYIIDEVHMVTTSGFNALLKTLEEPPEHVVFILATTSPEKLLDTVLSRCQRFDFRNLSTANLVAHIKEISQVEKISFANDEIINEIALQGNGSVRDTLSILDQILSYTVERNISEEVVVAALGLARTSSIKTMIEMMFNCDSVGVSKIYRTLIEENVSLKNIIRNILDRCFSIITRIDDQVWLQKNFNIDFSSFSRSEIFWIYETIAKDSNWVLESIDPVSVFEIVLHKIAFRRTFFHEKKKSDLGEQKVSQEAKRETTQVQKPTESVNTQNNKPNELLKTENIKSDWSDFLRYLFSVSPASAANLEQGNITRPIVFDGHGTIDIEIGYRKACMVFYDYMQESDVQHKIKNHISSFYKVTQEKIKLNFVLIEEKDGERFHSLAEKSIQKEKEQKENLNRELVNDPVIQELAKVFSSKVELVDKRYVDNFFDKNNVNNSNNIKKN